NECSDSGSHFEGRAQFARLPPTSIRGFAKTCGAQDRLPLSKPDPPTDGSGARSLAATDQEQRAKLGKQGPLFCRSGGSDASRADRSFKKQGSIKTGRRTTAAG